MSLLNKTILSFFPSKAHCTFVGEPWFLKNYELQLDVLRLCQMGYAKLLYTPLDRHTFVQHVMCCTRRYIDETYYTNNQTYYSRFIEYITSNISGGYYLLTRGWFCGETNYRHVNIFLIELNGCSYLINPVAGDFNEHIDSVMKCIVGCYDIYGPYARSLIVDGNCNAFFNQRIVNNDIKGGYNVVRVLPSYVQETSIWATPLTPDEVVEEVDDDYELYDDSNDVFTDYYAFCNSGMSGNYFFNDIDLQQLNLA